MSEENVKKEEEQKKEVVQSSVPDWAIWVGVGAVVAAATATTIYMVREKRQRELEMMRYGHVKPRKSAFNFSKMRERFSTFWGWTASSFTQVNDYISSFLKRKPEEGSLVSSPDQETRDEDSDSDCLLKESEEQEL